MASGDRAMLTIVSGLRYLHLDVFADRPLEGNQLAVFPDPGDLSTAEMQAIAREMNFSESTFIFRPQTVGDGRVRMRIFTPCAELPMAGHPTIGSTFALAAEGTIAAGRSAFVFELCVGPTPVSLDWVDGRLDFVWMTQLLPSFGREIRDREAFAAAIGVDGSDLVAGLPIEEISCGVPYLLVPLGSRSAVDRVTLDRRAAARCLEQHGLPERPCFFFTTEAAEAAPEETIYSRMLAPGFGITEDPATGSASGPLGCYLVHHEVVGSDAAQRIISRQGVAIGRSSRIHICIDADDGAIARVRIGGRAIIVGHGQLTL